MSHVTGPDNNLDVAPLRDRIYHQLEQLLVQGEFADGEHLRESDLAQRFGVSRGPVREALRMLERDGWVEWRLRRGAFVREPTTQEVEEFFEVRVLIEAESARLAAIRGSAEAEAALSPIIETATAALQANASPSDLTGYTMRFHASVAALAGNRILTDFSNRLNNWTRRLMVPIVPKVSRQAWREHAEIKDAIAKGEAKQAEALMRAHVESSKRAYLSIRGKA
jgi:DNA-binding GntR family transcriptional regulator